MYVRKVYTSDKLALLGMQNMFSPVNENVVYDSEIWWADVFDTMAYAIFYINIMQKVHNSLKGYNIYRQRQSVKFKNDCIRTDSTVKAVVAFR